MLSIDGEHEQALTSLAPLYAEAGEWDRLVAIRQRQITRAARPRRGCTGTSPSARVFRVHLPDPSGRASTTSTRWPSTRAGSRRCAGSPRPASRPRSRMQAVRALDWLCELVAEHQDVDAEVAIHLRIASIWEHLQDLQSAHARLQRSMALRPDDPEVLRRTIAVALAQGRRAAPRRLEYAAELLGPIAGSSE